MDLHVVVVLDSGGTVELHGGGLPVSAVAESLALLGTIGNSLLTGEQVLIQTPVGIDLTTTAGDGA